MMNVLDEASLGGIGFSCGRSLFLSISLFGCAQVAVPSGTVAPGKLPLTFSFDIEKPGFYQLCLLSSIDWCYRWPLRRRPQPWPLFAP